MKFMPTVTTGAYNGTEDFLGQDQSVPISIQIASQRHQGTYTTDPTCCETHWPAVASLAGQGMAIATYALMMASKEPSQMVVGGIGAALSAVGLVSLISVFKHSWDAPKSAHTGLALSSLLQIAPLAVALSHFGGKLYSLEGSSPFAPAVFGLGIASIIFQVGMGAAHTVAACSS
jgi:hypothetical protein